VGGMAYFSEVFSSTVQGAQNSLATAALKTIAQGEHTFTFKMNTLIKLTQ